MLMRVPDERESSVTDVGRKKIQLAVTSFNFILHPKTGNTWEKYKGRILHSKAPVGPLGSAGSGPQHLGVCGL